MPAVFGNVFDKYYWAGTNCNTNISVRDQSRSGNLNMPKVCGQLWSATFANYYSIHCYYSSGLFLLVKWVGSFLLLIKLYSVKILLLHRTLYSCVMVILRPLGIGKILLLVVQIEEFVKINGNKLELTYNIWCIIVTLALAHNFVSVEIKLIFKPI